MPSVVPPAARIASDSDLVALAAKSISFHDAVSCRNPSAKSPVDAAVRFALLRSICMCLFIVSVSYPIWLSALDVRITESITLDASFTIPTIASVALLAIALIPLNIAPPTATPMAVLLVISLPRLLEIFVPVP